MQRTFLRCLSDVNSGDYTDRLSQSKLIYSLGLPAAAKQCAANALTFLGQVHPVWLACQHPHDPFDGFRDWIWSC